MEFKKRQLALEEKKWAAETDERRKQAEQAAKKDEAMFASMLQQPELTFFHTHTLGVQSLSHSTFFFFQKRKNVKESHFLSTSFLSSNV